MQNFTKKLNRIFYASVYISRCDRMEVVYNLILLRIHLPERPYFESH